MSYLDQTSRNKPRTIAAVAILHAGLGYLIVSGLAITVFKTPPVVTTAETYPDMPDPPPPHDVLPPKQDSRVAQPTKRVVEIPNDTLTQTLDVRPVDPFPVKPNVDQGTVAPPLPVQIKANLARAAEPGPGRAGWVTPEDYPAGPLREGVTGTVGITVAIGIDGRVQGCEVTKSSGNTQLDESTCRIYARRARFKPALDADGKPATWHYSDRIRWELPPQ